MSTSLEVTPACSQKPAEAHKGQGAIASQLEPVRFSQSRRLWQAELAVYLATLLFAGLATFPFLLAAWYWPTALLAFLFFIGWHVKRCWHKRHFSSQMLYCTQDRWYLRDQGGEQEIRLCDEILLWTHLIVLPVSTASGEKKYLILTPDAMEVDDWRRLRVWLRFCADKG